MTTLFLFALAGMVLYFTNRFFRMRKENAARYTPRDHIFFQARTLRGTTSSNADMASIFPKLKSVTAAEHPERSQGGGEARFLYVIDLPEHNGSESSQINPVVRYYMGGDKKTARTLSETVDARFASIELSESDNPFATEIAILRAEHDPPASP